MRLMGLIGGLMLLAAGCGPAVPGLGNGGSYACDYTQSSTHFCQEWSWNVPGYSSAAYQQACTGYGGTAGTACTHTGAIGGCRYTSSAGTVSVTVTQWYYSGDATQLMNACGGANCSGGNTCSWVAP